MNVGFWFTDDTYQGALPTAGGGMDVGGAAVAAKCGFALLRPYYKGNPTPSSIATTILQMDHEIAQLRDKPHEVFYQLGNEPNLPQEDWAGGLLGYVAFFKAVRTLLPAQIKLAWAGISPSTPDYADWYAPAVDARADAVVAHVYGQNLHALQQITQTVLSKTPLPVIVGECNFGPGPSINVDKDAWAVDTWVPYLRWAAVRTQIKAALYFAYTWQADMPVGTPVDARGSRIVVETLAYASQPPPVLKTPPAGRAWWVWYVNECGDAPGIIEACKRTRATAVFLKGGDGPYAWPQITQTLVDQITQAGIDVYLWHYAYLGWVQGNVHGDAFKWSVDDEVTCVRDMLARGGPNVKGFVADVEAESEGRWLQATSYGNAVRDLLGERWFAYAPLPVIDYHQTLPYVQFNAVCDNVMPQFYSKNLQGDPAWTYTRLVEQWLRWSATWRQNNQQAPPLMPIGEAYGLADDQSIYEFEQWAVLQEWPCWSYWSLQHALQGNLIAILENEAPQDMTIKLSPEDASTVQQIFENVWAGAEHLNAILAKTAYGPVGARTGYWGEQTLKGATDLLKELLSMNNGAT